MRRYPPAHQQQWLPLHQLGTLTLRRRTCLAQMTCRSLAVGNGQWKRSAEEYSLRALAALNGLLSEGRSGAHPIRALSPVCQAGFIRVPAAGQKEVGNFEACPQTSTTDLFNFHRLPRRTEAAEPPWPRNHAQSGVQISTPPVVECDGNTGCRRQHGIESIHAGRCRVSHCVLPHHATERTLRKLLAIFTPSHLYLHDLRDAPGN